MEQSPKLLPEQSLITKLGMNDIWMRYMGEKLDWDCYMDIKRERVYHSGTYEPRESTIHIEDTYTRGDE